MQNKHYVVVGGSSGIGLALVRKLAMEGAYVTVLSRTGDELVGMPTVTHVEYDALGNEFPDVEIPEAIHGFVYCPGSIVLKPFSSLKPDQYREDFELNVVGAVKSLKGCLKALKKAESASVVLFSTIAVGQGLRFHASVAAAKGAVEGLSRALAAELTPKVRVNCIAPALVDTPLAGRILSTPEKKEAQGQNNPMGRVGEPEDVAETAFFLLSDKSSWITGQTFGVDGGMSVLR
ncbi:MAG: SDR family oxidoreductase [Bacteroidota bacterium]